MQGRVLDTPTLCALPRQEAPPQHEVAADSHSQLHCTKESTARGTLGAKSLQQQIHQDGTEAAFPERRRHLVRALSEFEF